MPTCEDEFFVWLSQVNCSKIKLYALQDGSVVISIAFIDNP